MAALPVQGFKDGGFLWFTDLTAVDSYYVLPVLGGLSLLLSMEVIYYCLFD
jgi:YidC/Oxa1 family membrane protein insertase